MHCYSHNTTTTALFFQIYHYIRSYYEWLRRQFAHKRSILATGLESAGITPLPSQGGFFLMGRLPGLPASTPSSQQLLQQV